MKVTLKDMGKKLALWHTPTFRPIMSHDDLEPIMDSVGFVPLPAYSSPPSASMKPQVSPPNAAPAIQWKEYAFPSSSSSAAASAAADSGYIPRRPRLPFPKIYGLHLIIYKAFFSALERHIAPSVVSDLFHVRAMPLTLSHDRVFEKAYRSMRDCKFDDEGIYLFRQGTIDQCMAEHIAAMERNSESNEDGNDGRMKGRSSSATPIFLVSLDSLLPKKDIRSMILG